jgi:hypothetical protein
MDSTSSLVAAELNLRLKTILERAKSVIENRFDCEVRVREDRTLEPLPRRPLDEEDRKLLGQVTSMLSNEILQLHKRYLELANLEKNIDLLVEGIGESDSNVLSLEQFRREKSVEPSAPSKRQIYFAVPCFIEGSNEMDRHGMAFELHSASNRMAFVPFADIDLPVRISSEKISQLGPITIFLSSIEKLSTLERVALLDYCRGPRTAMTPHIITSSEKNYSDLVADKAVPMELLNALAVSIIRMTKAFDEYRGAGVVPFLYESLLDRSLEKDL